jgi:hypothetical protein|uniref:Major capsid protein n=1 Tax=Podoviridae sp. ctiJY10 TaxID=2826572 RepID=A0A8S5N591_9CAUD|nr:MAG TPA: Major capsid protein [Podoviridae sp. ctiJY10]
MTIFDLVKAPELTSYWEEHRQDMPPYLGEELFPADKKLGLKLDWIKGANGLPVVLKPSAFDVGAVPRPRIGFDKLSAEMPFFKESTYIDEELRQQLNMVMETGNQAYIDAVMNRVFADEMHLLEGARARREQMRMMALTTGAIAITANGQAYNYDYGIPSDHKSEVTTSWSTTTSDPIEDMRKAMDKIEDDTGVRPTRGVCTRKTWGYLRVNEKIIKSIFVLSNGQVSALSDARLSQYLMDELGLELIVYGKRYKNDAGTATQFVPDDTVVLFPEGTLGNTWFGTTPEESDLMGTGAANVSITDTGVAVTTVQKTDPVNVETKVTMICLPSFESADSVYILDVIAS